MEPVLRPEASPAAPAAGRVARRDRRGPRKRRDEREGPGHFALELQRRADDDAEPVPAAGAEPPAAGAAQHHGPWPQESELGGRIDVVA